VALVLIYLLLARAFSGWVMPLIALTPLVVGIAWTMGTLELVFDSLNLFTAMMMLVLLGLGIDFSIHIISRFREELRLRQDLEAACEVTFTTSGVAVIIGALTTALAFLTLMVGETQGVFEFGAATGLGVGLTLIAIFVTLPSLLVLKYRNRIQVAETPSASLHGEGYAWIGRIAGAGWRHPGLFLGATILLGAASVWALRHTAYEYDFLELEAEGLRSVELQREIPRRFGTSDHSTWLVTETVEQSRAFKEQFRKLPEVGDVNAISDFVPSPERLNAYAPRLEQFRRGTLSRERLPWRPGDREALAAEIDRLWDNLDLMSNLAYTAGLDRIVSVIDQMTGVDSETGETDTRALLPTVSRRLREDIGDERMQALAEAWALQLRANLERMTNAEPVSVDQVPEQMRRMFTARVGDGYLLHVVPRRYLWDRLSLERFASQTASVHPDVVGSEQLILVMMDETLADGRAAALLALAVIGTLLLVHFRGPMGLVALVPLAVGSLAMLGMMYVLGMKYNYMNLIATPIILGIGIDDGVHALHRFRHEAAHGYERVTTSFRLVGRAILLTSLTTMIGFGSVAFYEMRGMASFGQVLFFGVGFCFLATIFVLPATLRLVTREPRAQESRDAPEQEARYAAS
jgi:predicted RND superfamily exporter protein